ncbi:MAG: transporter substrate-binding domain-containing protein, partial [Campylobacterota bacterium]|nr:transporter substrate-binding domain-containing protein [Campylobacterota bacterium]
MGFIKKEIVVDDLIFNDKALNLTKIEKRYLENKKNIKMCIDPDWMPFESFDKDGKHIGISSNYFKIFQKNISIPIEVVTTRSWSQSLKYIREKKCDILSLVMSTPKRKEYLNFTKPYMHIPLVLATKLDIRFVSSIDALTDEKIGIPKDYAFLEILQKKYPNLNIVEVDNIQDGLEKVADGRLFGYIGTVVSITHLFQKSFIGKLKIAAKLDDTWRLSIGVRIDDKNLLSIFEKSVSMIEPKEKQKILNNWLSVKYDKSIDYTLIWQLIALFTFIIFLFIYRQIILKKEVAKATKSIEEKN